MTSSAVAVPGVAVVGGTGLGAVVAASCAITILAQKSSTLAAVKNLFIGNCLENWGFEIERFDCLTNPEGNMENNGLHEAL